MIAFLLVLAECLDSGKTLRVHYTLQHYKSVDVVVVEYYTNGGY